MESQAHILLVDSDNESSINTAAILALNSWEVTTVVSGFIAMKTILAGKKDFDMVIIDVDLPDMDSFQLCGDIDKMGILVVVTSTKEDPELTYKALDSGALLFVKKPFEDLSTKYLHQFVVRQRILRSKMKRYEETLAMSNVQSSGLCFSESNNKDATSKNDTKEGDSGHLYQGYLLCDEQNLNAEPSSFDKFNKKKISIQWTKELHQKFMDAVKELGQGNCYPKDILEVMNVPDMTSAQVASHLQKCRLGKWKSPTKRKNQSRRNKLSKLVVGDVRSNKIKVFGAMPHESQTKVQNNLPLVSVPSFGNKIPKELHTSYSRNGTPTNFNTPPIAYLPETENVQERMTENADLLKGTSLIWTTQDGSIIDPKSQSWSIPPPTFDFVSSSSSKNSSATGYGYIHVANNGVTPNNGAVNENINSISSLNISNVATGDFFIGDEEMNFLIPDFQSYALEKKFGNYDNHLGDKSFSKD